MNLLSRVVNKRIEHYDLYIGRGSIWGNPYVIGRDGDRSQVIAKFEKYLRSDTSLMDQLHLIDGKILGCFCKPYDCHGDVLVRVRTEQLDT